MGKLDGFFFLSNFGFPYSFFLFQFSTLNILFPLTPYARKKKKKKKKKKKGKLQETDDTLRITPLQSFPVCCWVLGGC